MLITCEQAVLVKEKELLILSSLDGVKGKHLKLTSVQREGETVRQAPALPLPVRACFIHIKIFLAVFRGQKLILISRRNLPVEKWRVKAFMDCTMTVTTFRIYVSWRLWSRRWCVLGMSGASLGCLSSSFKKAKSSILDLKMGKSHEKSNSQKRK